MRNPGVTSYSPLPAQYSIFNKVLKFLFFEILYILTLPAHHPLIYIHFPLYSYGYELITLYLDYCKMVTWYLLILFSSKNHFFPLNTER